MLRWIAVLIVALAALSILALLGFPASGAAVGVAAGIAVPLWLLGRKQTGS